MFSIPNTLSVCSLMEPDLLTDLQRNLQRIKGKTTMNYAFTAANLEHWLLLFVIAYLGMSLFGSWCASAMDKQDKGQLDK